MSMSQKRDIKAMQVLPNHILRKQVCQECYNYLSVPPIVINNQGETICGRCMGLTVDEQKTESLFNIIARGFHFKCINHFNGCPKILAFDEIRLHEKECSYENQECIFCSFSGNLSQIFNHSVKVHSENVSYDGIVLLPLHYTFKKIFLVPIKDNHLLLVKIELTELLFTIVLKLLTKELPLNINQYAVKFYKPGDHEFSDYGQFSLNLENTMEKPKEELVKIFGLTNIHCQILMDTFTIEKKELELQKRILDLRHAEERVTKLEHNLQIEHAKLLQRCERYDFAVEVIKKMSHYFTNCSKCNKVITGETFFCPKFHCLCKQCLSSFCSVCKGVREFSELSGLKEFIVTCDWPGCDVNISIKEIWTHKRECNFRPYKCPLKNCNKILLSIEKLKEHWHATSPNLVEGKEITCDKHGCEEYYWIIKNDVYHLVINFNLNDIQVYVEGYNVLQDVPKFECWGFWGGKWYLIKMLEFWGRYQVNTENQAEFTRIKIEIEVD